MRIFTDPEAIAFAKWQKAEVHMPPFSKHGTVVELKDANQLRCFKGRLPITRLHDHQLKLSSSPHGDVATAAQDYQVMMDNTKMAA
jgi:hypothetical protein